MSKNIKLEDQVYDELEAIGVKRETYSQTVSRLISFHREISRLVWVYSQKQTQTRGPGSKMAPIKSYAAEEGK